MNDLRFERPLEKSLHRFDPDHFGTLAELLADPDPDGHDTLFVACSDHGTAPDNVSFASPEKLYIVQNMAASIPAATDSALPTVLESIAYAITVENVRHAVVCDHLGCTLIPHWAERPGRCCRQLSDFHRRAKVLVDETYPEATGPSRHGLLVREHALCQLENLQSHDFVRERIEDGRLRLHGWVADDETARVHAFDPSTGQFARV